MREREGDESVGDAAAEDPEPHIDDVDYDEDLQQTDCYVIFDHLLSFLLGDFCNGVVGYDRKDFC